MNKNSKYIRDPYIGTFKLFEQSSTYVFCWYWWRKSKTILVVFTLLSISSAQISELLHPGKLDVFYSSTIKSGLNKYNLIFWSPIFKGGYGSVSSGIRYGGGFFRPFLSRPNIGDLVLGLQFLEVEEESQIEIQTEYRFKFGLSIGSGIVDRGENDNDITFTKLSYRNFWNRLKYIVTVQTQQTVGITSLGGYLALYDENFMGVVGFDGEQRRTTFGYVAPKNENTQWRPSLEVLYVDNRIGKLAGPQFIFANATLGFSGGFLSHPARLGRAMGPTGIEFGNPLGFLKSTFNRRLNVWELGGIANFRLVRLDLNGSSTEALEATLFPWQIFKSDGSFVSQFFIGAELNKSEQDDWMSTGMFGYFGKMGTIVLSLKGSYNFNIEENSLFIGFIYPL
tara:strand:- start:214 stop:1398 length:1185 start_codon:yes stop_codon:yes gene_type:complete